MKTIIFKATKIMQVGGFAPFMYRPFTLQDRETIEVPEWLAEKMVNEYPDNIEIFVKEDQKEKDPILDYVPQTYYDKVKFANKLGYDGSEGKSEKVLDEYIDEAQRNLRSNS